MGGLFFRFLVLGYLVKDKSNLHFVSKIGIEV